MSDVCAVATFGPQRPFSGPREVAESLLTRPSSLPANIKLWSSEHSALGVAFTPTLPEDRFDAQPIQGADRPFHLVADLRLDNRSDLAHQLSLTQPETLADSTILAAAWDRWGPDCLDRLLGAFAICVWDPRTQELFAARDHAGEYPLFFHRSHGWIAVASSAQVLRTLPQAPQGFNEQRIADWLVHLHRDSSASFFEGIEKLAAGHLLRASADRFEVRQYWHLSAAKPIRYKRDAEYADALTDLLDQAVEPRLRTNGAVAAQLSAGLDSASVATSAALLLDRQSQRLTAYTAVPQPGFEEDRASWWIMDEGPGAAEVAALYPNIDHNLISVESMPLVATLASIAAYFDEPLLNGVNWMWFLASLRQARQRGAGVLLNGVQGNVNISYETTRPLRHMLRRGQWLRFARNGLQQRSFGSSSFRGLAGFALSAILPWARDSSDLLRHDFDSYPVNPQFSQKYGLREAALGAQIELPTDAADLLAGLQRADSGSANATAFAMTGVQLRDPTADKRIWEFCSSIPPEQFVAEGMSRSLIRRAMRKRLPETTLRRTRRGLQGADWHMIVRQALPALRAQIDALDESPAVHRYLDLPRLRKVLDTLPDADVHNEEAFYVSHLTMLRAITLGIFLHRHDPEVRRSGKP